MKLTDYIIFEKPEPHVRSEYTARVRGISAICGHGASREAATADLFRQLDRATAGPSHPGMFGFAGHIALVWREGEDWWYTIQPADHAGVILGNLHLLGKNREETERAARRHLADYALDGGMEAREAAAIIGDAGERADFLKRAAFGRRVAAIMEEKGCTWQEACEEADGLGMAPDRRAERAAANESQQEEGVA